MPPRLVITDMKTFSERYHLLSRGDIVVGLLNLKKTEESKFLHLVEKGVKLFPPALAQATSRSKATQAYVLGQFMVEHTFVARDKRDLIEQTTNYNARHIREVVTKQDRFNCGLGINVWNSIEEVYNQASLGHMEFPFVVQPFVPNARDIRVIIIGRYVEAYERKNPHNFRNNIYFGGESRPYPLSRKELSFCRKVMKQAHFPYAHMDLMLSGDKIYLAEINLRGGLKGSQIKTEQYLPLINQVHQDFLKNNRPVSALPGASFSSPGQSQ